MHEVQRKLDLLQGSETETAFVMAGLKMSQSSWLHNHNLACCHCDVAYLLGHFSVSASCVQKFSYPSSRKSYMMSL